MLALALCYEQDASVLITYNKLNINLLCIVHKHGPYHRIDCLHVPFRIHLDLFAGKPLRQVFIQREGCGISLCIMSPS